MTQTVRWCDCCAAEVEKLEPLRLTEGHSDSAWATPVWRISLCRTCAKFLRERRWGDLDACSGIYNGETVVDRVAP